MTRVERIGLPLTLLAGLIITNVAADPARAAAGAAFGIGLALLIDPRRI